MDSDELKHNRLSHFLMKFGLDGPGVAKFVVMQAVMSEIFWLASVIVCMRWHPLEAYLMKTHTSKILNWLNSLAVKTRDVSGRWVDKWINFSSASRYPLLRRLGGPTAANNLRNAVIAVPEGTLLYYLTSPVWYFAGCALIISYLRHPDFVDAAHDQPSPPLDNPAARHTTPADNGTPPAASLPRRPPPPRLPPTPLHRAANALNKAVSRVRSLQWPQYRNPVSGVWSLDRYSI